MHSGLRTQREGMASHFVALKSTAPANTHHSVISERFVVLFFRPMSHPQQVCDPQLFQRQLFPRQFWKLHVISANPGVLLRKHRQSNIKKQQTPSTEKLIQMNQNDHLLLFLPLIFVSGLTCFLVPWVLIYVSVQTPCKQLAIRSPCPISLHF